MSEVAWSEIRTAPGCRGELMRVCHLLVRVCLMASPTAQSPALPAEGDEGSLEPAAQQESGKVHGRLRLQAAEASLDGIPSSV